MTIHIPVLTCKTCKCQFARSRRILFQGRFIVRFETRAKYCSNACRQKDYRNRLILKRRLSVTQNRLSVTIA